jgi:hypothetical protein
MQASIHSESAANAGGDVSPTPTPQPSPTTQRLVQVVEHLLHHKLDKWDHTEACHKVGRWSPCRQRYLS